MTGTASTIEWPDSAGAAARRVRWYFGRCQRDHGRRQVYPDHLRLPEVLGGQEGGRPGARPKVQRSPRWFEVGERGGERIEVTRTGNRIPARRKAVEVPAKRAA